MSSPFAPDWQHDNRPWRVAVRARLHHRDLDRELAIGISPWRSPVHAARYRQLTCRRRRTNLASSLERLLDEALHPRTMLRSTPAIPPMRSAVIEAAEIIDALIAELRAPGPVRAEGIVRLERLLADGTGPVYSPARPGTLSGALDRIAQWLAAQE